MTGGASEPTPARCTGVILAGGGATRFGGAPKGLARLAGSRVLDRVAAALRQSADSLLLVANDPDAASWLPGVPVVRDETPGCGPLGGLQAALRRTARPVLVVAWDMPFVTAPLLRALRDAGERAGPGAVLPEGPDGLPEPLCAWYDGAAIAVVDALLARGERRMSALAEALAVERLPRDAVARCGDPARLFANVNTPDDLARAEELLRG
ncbi:MAG TPA: molybdenum cofactor guanylyltransferase [Gemmatimonadaceae bacterium]|nr:molybdenum cofactor guanylyltransferase [Gemmatimonadaceae bacterium]